MTSRGRMGAAILRAMDGRTIHARLKSHDPLTRATVYEVSPEAARVFDVDMTNLDDRRRNMLGISIEVVKSMPCTVAELAQRENAFDLDRWTILVHGLALGVWELVPAV